MPPLIYLSKVILCSALLFGYYFIALRNRIFHQYNRFYLLFSVVISWVIPFLKFNFTSNQMLQKPIFHALTLISESNTAFENESIIEIKTTYNWIELLPLLYIVIATIILIRILISLYKIYQIYKKYPRQKMENIILLKTNESGTPFSFFKYIFWNEDIDMESITGNQILQHEITHVNEKHSWDIIFIQINLVLGWFNPIFWLFKKEIEVIHEFIADKKAIVSANSIDFATMLLVATFPKNQFNLTNPFFFSPIKRRLTMLSQNKKTKFAYLRRVIVLPLLAIVFLLFAFRIKDNNKSANSNLLEKQLTNEITLNSKLTNKYKIVIDAGHGGVDLGCQSADGTLYEKEVDLAIAKKILQLNINKNIEIILDRNDDHFDNVKEKVEYINNQKPDLAVSLHCNDAGTNEADNGTEIYVVNPEKSNVFINESNSFAQIVNEELKQYFVNRGIKTRKQGIWILQASKCPIILVENGFLSNRKDVAILKQPEQQALIARLILKGIENYLSFKENRK